ncbi:MAG: hypothetical protein M1821_001731 [Bathelium mastoideum]|nr:MAG: hypothetical protein M1821_001731 [Bathelium mastoideum]KAI9691629.1 MAG: hypothetical protein M1822_007700 [Bathelium mastoideum]
MPLDGSSINAVNTPPTSIPRQLQSFTLYAPNGTDLYRQIPATDTVTAPILYLTPSSPFTAAEVTVSAKWELEWDQAGLVIFTGEVSSSINGTTNPPAEPRQPADVNGTSPRQDDGDQAPPAYSAPVRPAKWVKASLEFTNNALHATSVSATSDGADLTIAPLPPPHYNTHELPIPPPTTTSFDPAPFFVSPNRDVFSFPAPSPAWDRYPPPPLSHQLLRRPGRTDLRLKLERIGYALWVWYEDPGPLPELAQQQPSSLSSGWRKLREVSGFFWGVEDKQIRIGVTASRPANFGVSAWEREHGGGGAAGEDEGEDDVRGAEGESVTARRGLLVHFEDLEIW